MNNKPLIIIGGGGHASVLADILLKQGREVLAVVSPKCIKKRKVFDTIMHYLNDDEVCKHNPQDIFLINGIGQMPYSNLRFTIQRKFKELGFTFESVIACSAEVSHYSCIEPGVQILNAAVIQTGSRIREGTIINTGSIVEHDCDIGIFNHLATGTTLSGQVKTGENVHVGTGASVIQNLRIGKSSIIGAGAIILKDVPESSIVFGFRNEPTKR